MNELDPTVEHDETVSKDSSLTVLSATKQYMDQAKAARAERQKQSDQNTELYLGRQDLSHKTVGQSAEFLPLLPIAVEKIGQFVKRALVDFGDWFSVDLSDNPVLTDNQAREILLSQINSRTKVDHAALDFPTLISDAVKTGLLQSLMIFKVYGRDYCKKKFHIEKGEETIEGQKRTTYKVEQKDKYEWHLCIDLVNPDDYYPDPTGRGLFKIHRVRRDLHDLVALADTDDSPYDLDVIQNIVGDFVEAEATYRQALKTNQDEATKPDFRKEVTIDECWGDILDEEGNVVHKNCVWAVANEKYLIRKPEPNPWWHNQTPFVETPLLRVPFSTWHKALADLAGPLNIAANELFNLMLDGAFGAVHGTKQLRTDLVERPEELSGGIPPGTVIAIKAETPPGVKVLERIDESAIPPDTMQMFGILIDQFQTAMQTNDVQMGQIPNKNIQATALVQADQSISGFFDGIVRDIEVHGISRILWLSWMVIAQEMDDMSLKYIKTSDTRKALSQLHFMKPEERFVVLANDIAFEVRGLSGTMARSRDFQKFMAFLQAIGTNPMLLQAFFSKYSPDKALQQLMKYLNLNPAGMEMSEQEQATMDQRMQQMQQMAGVAGGGSQNRAEAGGASEEAAMGQASNPLSGIAGAGGAG